MIDIRNLNFRYADGTHALLDINVQVPPEHIFAILGQSGSGKTTLLNCIARFLTPTTGRILYHDQDIFAMPEQQFRETIGVVFQDLHLFPHLTILQNMILAPRKVRDMPARRARQLAHDMLQRLGIPELADNYPAQVSGGQAQRVAIARALMMEPAYLLLDEPTSALDARTTGDFALWLRELHENTNFIIVTHDLPFADQIARHGIYMENGRITHTGPIHPLLQTIRSS